jgi:hypothetical protein
MGVELMVSPSFSDAVIDEAIRYIPGATRDSVVIAAQDWFSFHACYQLKIKVAGRMVCLGREYLPKVTVV